jgi:hypothetical protein
MVLFFEFREGLMLPLIAELRDNHIQNLNVSRHRAIRYNYG